MLESLYKSLYKVYIVEGLYGKFKFLEKAVFEENLVSFQSFNPIAPISDGIAASISHREGLLIDFERTHYDLLMLNFLPWFVGLENYESGDEYVELAEM